MRIIAGSLRSRSLQAPPGLATRPTSDRLRETLFNVLAPRIADAHVLDLYAGSGAVGMEALSRGAARVVFVESAPGALKVLRANLARLALNQGFDIQAGAVTTYLRRAAQTPFDIIFLDPPYDAEREYEQTLALLAGDARGFLRPGAIVIAEHRRKDNLPETPGALHRTRLLQQGDAALSFYSLTQPPADSQEGNS